MEVEVYDYLLDAGCCYHCIEIFCNIKSNIIIENAPNSSSVKDDGKKNRLTTCTACLGILQFCASNDVLGKLSEKFFKEDSDSLTFSLSISLPICLSIRIHWIWVHLMKKFPQFNSVPAREHHLGVLKDRWRTLTGTNLAEWIDKSFVGPEVSNFTMLVVVEYPNDETECESIECLSKDVFDTRRVQHNKYKEGIYSRKGIMDVLDNCNDEKFLQCFPQLPLEPAASISLDNCQCTHVSLYIAGRYNKYSRELSQTPWVVEGERRMESSVEELLSEHIKQKLRTICVFSSSGREDVDVRCLGKGRPFVLECLNPRKTRLTREDMLSLQHEINQSTSLIAVRDIQLVTKRDSSNMKIGEEEKTKSYAALCLCPNKTSSLDFSKIHNKGNVEIIQATPLRVLHRRPLLNRSRMVYSMEVEVIDEYFFKLLIETAAGTYIKEFVHGDYGRTQPNLGSLLDSRVDIIALDVVNVKLDWPPDTDDHMHH